jgi:hypothetical protein
VKGLTDSSHMACCGKVTQAANQRPKDSLLAVESDSFQQVRMSLHQLKVLWKVHVKGLTDSSHMACCGKYLLPTTKEHFQVMWHAISLSMAKVSFLSNGALWKVLTFRS